MHSGNLSVTQVTAHRQEWIWWAAHCAGVIGRCPTPRASTGPVDFALAPACVRLLGTGLVAIGVVVASVCWSAGSPGCPPTIVSGLVVLAGVGVVALGLLVGVRHWVLRLDETGYRVRVLRTAEARSARWTDVLDLQTGTVSGARCVVLRLRDGRTTALPVDAIEGDPIGSHRGADHPPRPWPRLPPTALRHLHRRVGSYRIFRRTPAWVPCGLLFWRCRLVRFMAPAC